MLKSVSFLAACSEVAQRWVSGQRHELALSFSGLCLKQEVDPQLLVNIIQRICKKTGDQEAQDRMNCVRTSVSKGSTPLILRTSERAQGRKRSALHHPFVV